MAVPGFDLHAGLVVPAGQRERLERLCRYALRPPVAQDRLHRTADGEVRLAVLVPRPRINLLLYGRALGPSPLRVSCFSS